MLFSIVWVVFCIVSIHHGMIITHLIGDVQVGYIYLFTLGQALSSRIVFANSVISAQLDAYASQTVRRNYLLSQCVH